MAIVGEPLKKYVVNQIRKRQEMHGDGVNNPRSESNLVLLNANNPWIKLASGVKVTKEKLINLGYSEANAELLQGKELAKANVLFGGLSKYDNGKLTQASKFIGDGGAYQFNEVWGAYPMPGIESIEVKSLNRGSLKKATVKLVAQTRDQLAILDVLYLRLGYTVLLEWGNSFYKSSQEDDPNTKEVDERIIIEQINQTLIDNEEKFFSSAYDKNVSHLTILPAIEKLREKHQGNYDALFGKISNFNWSFQPDGSYDIEITIISLGDIVESLKSNVVASSKVLQFVNNIPSPGESTTLDKARKDNIILSYLQIFKFIAISKIGNKLSIETTSNSDNSKRTAYPANLLVTGDSIIATADSYTYTITGKFGIVDTDKNEYVGEDPSYIRDNGGGGYWISKTTQAAKRTPPIIFPERWVKGNLYSKFPPSLPDGNVFFGDAFNTLKNIELQPTNLDGRKQVGYYNLTYTKDFNQTQHTLYELNKASGNITDPNDEIYIWIKGFDDQYNKTVDIDFTITLDSKVFKAKELFTVPDKVLGQGLFPFGINFKWNREPRSVVSVANNPQSLPNPLSNSDYEASDCFRLNLDTPEYYIRFGYLLNLVKQKCITRIDQGNSNYNKNPNLFNINNTSANMTCLPNQISFDWRKCIVARKDFNRASWSYNQVIFPELLNTQWPLGTSQVANAMNIYLNFEFIAETLTSNLDEKGNISVYNFIKSLCDGINIALGGVNNLEPIIDEDDNTLNILDSTPNTHKNTQSPDYTLKLYGYSQQNYRNGPGDASTFVRKVDLKTAITPEYATMVTVGATAGGYVKGIEATAFSKWNDGILDRFKEVLIAADEDSKDSGNKKEDPIASFEIAMGWTARCFGIEGGILADLFP